MIDSNDVITFFDKCAPSWDEEMIRDDEIISIILDNAGVKSSSKVLDVACGTGVLFGDYISRNVKSILGVDISPEMIKIAQEKCEKICSAYKDERSPQLSVICGDIMKLEDNNMEGTFDVVMVYNAFPHFPDGAALVKKLSSFLKIGGVLSVAHGMSKEQIDKHHSGSAHHVSKGLIEVEDMASLFEPYFDITTKISNNNMYQVCGIRR